MSTNSSQEPNRPTSFSDEALLDAHASQTAPGVPLWIPTLFVFVVSAILCAAGIYIDRNSGDFSAVAYNEDARLAQGPSAAPKPVDMVAFGKKQYLSACVTCHQPNGLGTPGIYPPLAGSEWVQGSEERVIRIVLHGLNGPVKVAGQTYTGSVAMPSFGKVPNSGYNWRDDQIAAVLTYVRQEWGNKASPISTEKVAEIRNKVTRDKAWTAEELEALP